MDESSFITRIVVGSPSPIPSIELTLAFPHDVDGDHKVNVIAGKNRTGKSHILHNVARCLERYCKEPGPLVTHANVATHFSAVAKSINWVCVPNVERLRTIGVTCPLRPLKRGMNNDAFTRTLRRAQAAFYADQIARHPLLGGSSGESGNEMRTEVRVTPNPVSGEVDPNSTLRSFESRLRPGRLFRCDLSSPVAQEFQRLTGGALYFVYDNGNKASTVLLPFVRYSDNQLFGYENWSQGQQMLFGYLIILHYLKLDVLLIDEPESFLHPEYASTVLETARKNVPQTVLATHHPHVIFSRYVDRCWYIELVPAAIEHPVECELPKLDRSMQAHFMRRARNIDVDYAKAAAVYGLFSNYDANLLRLAQSGFTLVSEALVRQLIAAFSNDIKPPSSQANPDLQSDGIAELIARDLHDHVGKYEVFDFGSGLGRTVVESQKRLQEAEKARVHWTLWEPQAHVRQALRTQIGQNYETLSIPDTVPKDGAFDLIVLANVLHECTPDDVAKILSLCRTRLRQGEHAGKVIVAELYPLLHPEKYAVPYSRDQMEEVFDRIGWRTTSSNFHFKSGAHSAYWVLAEPRAPRDLADATIALAEYWDSILDATLRRYDGIQRLDTPSNVVETLGLLTTIASINAYKRGRWTPLS